MGKSHQCTIEVRGYELDSYNHVNHAVYLNYLEHARWKFLSDNGIRRADLDRLQRWPVIAHADVSYLKPTFMGQELRIESQVTEHGRSWFLVEQTILHGDVPVLKAKMRIVVINESGRPAEAPPQLSALWEES